MERERWWLADVKEAKTAVNSSVNREFSQMRESIRNWLYGSQNSISYPQLALPAFSYLKK